MSIGGLGTFGITREECHAFLKWWIQELRELGDALLERLAPRLAKRLVIRFSDNIAHASAPRAGQRAMNFEFARDERGEWPERLDEFGPTGEHRGARVTLALAPSEVFTFDLILPEVSERDLKAVIDLHLEREWPVSRDPFAVDYRVVQRPRARADTKVQVLIARHEHIERLRELAQKWGLRAVRIGTADESGKIVGNFLPRRFRLRPIRSAALAPLERKLAAAAVVLACALAFVIAAQWTYERLVVGAALARLRSHATVASHFAHEFASESLPARQLLQISARPDAADVLGSLTRSIPANTWVYKLDVSVAGRGAPNIQLTAFAPAAAALVDILQQTHRFGTVRLDWAVSNGTRSGLDQLQVTASGSGSDSAQEIAGGAP